MRINYTYPPCDEPRPGYYFDHYSDKCRDDGCEHDGNWFGTVRECLESCDSNSKSRQKLLTHLRVISSFHSPIPGICLLPPEPGVCEAYIPSYFYNATSGQCEEFVYGGCGGNENRFESFTECMRNCDINSKSN